MQGPAYTREAMSPFIPKQRDRELRSTGVRSRANAATVRTGPGVERVIRPISGGEVHRVSQPVSATATGYRRSALEGQQVLGRNTF